MNERTEKDKVGQELAAQRFGMLADIARELTDGKVVFPTCFDAALRLRRELQNPDVALSRIAQIVQLEPLVAAKLMRLANSVAYSRGIPVRDLQSAVSRLGLNAVRTTALAVAMGEIMRAKDIAEFSALAQRLWEHSILCAAAARRLAREATKINAEEALLAGLVHDLGAFYMLYRAVQYPELRERPDTLRHLIAQWHEAIGASLLETLGLPPEIAQASIDHDHPRPIPEPLKTLPDVLYVANALAGGCRAWLQPNADAADDPQAEELQRFRERHAELMPEIEAEA
ncbi:MAG: HDOD domain-containing protein, partial [Candidatus Accumulibacter sp.]|nr:HDOD domain-containing protein [Accumulibacter sp.]